MWSWLYSPFGEKICHGKSDIRIIVRTFATLTALAGKGLTESENFFLRQFDEGRFCILIRHENRLLQLKGEDVVNNPK